MFLTSSLLPASDSGCENIGAAANPTDPTDHAADHADT